MEWGPRGTAGRRGYICSRRDCRLPCSVHDSPSDGAQHPEQIFLAPRRRDTPAAIHVDHARKASRRPGATDSGSGQAPTRTSDANHEGPPRNVEFPLFGSVPDILGQRVRGKPRTPPPRRDRLTQAMGRLPRRPPVRHSLQLRSVANVHQPCGCSDLFNWRTRGPHHDVAGSTGECRDLGGDCRTIRGSGPRLARNRLQYWIAEGLA